MKVSYRGVHKEFPPAFQEKLDAKFAKVSKLLEKRGEKEAHVVVTTQAHLFHAEITVQFYDHQLVGTGSDTDEFTAVHGAIEKLETQALKQTAKWREKTRRSDINGAAEEKTPLPNAGSDTPGQPQKVEIFRVNHHDQRKPMTLEEALMEMEKDRDYMVYRDADRQCVSVLVRRRDGNFDLIES
jgi:ribosomal subunit interface protein